MWERFWRRTAILSYEYPALWFPVMVADIVGFGLKNRRSMITSDLVSLLFRGHSVFGAEILDRSATRTALAYVLAATLVQFVRFASIALYAGAFFMMAYMVWRRTGQRSHRRSSGKKVLALSLRAFLFAIPLRLVACLPIFLIQINPGWYAISGSWLFVDLGSMLLMSALAYLMVPAALRALADSSLVNRDCRVRLGRTCAIAAVVTSTALMILERIVFGVIYGSRAEIATIQAVGSLIAALPYAPLYIALSLLVRDEPAETSEEQAMFAPGEG